MILSENPVPTFPDHAPGRVYIAAVREPAQTRFRPRPLFQRPDLPHLHNKKTWWCPAHNAGVFPSADAKCVNAATAPLL